VVQALVHISKQQVTCPKKQKKQVTRYVRCHPPPECVVKTSMEDSSFDNISNIGFGGLPKNNMKI